VSAVAVGEVDSLQSTVDSKNERTGSFRLSVEADGLAMLLFDTPASSTC